MSPGQAPGEADHAALIGSEVMFQESYRVCAHRPPVLNS